MSIQAGARLAIVAAFLACACGGQVSKEPVSRSESAAASASARVLFIGNSLLSTPSTSTGEQMHIVLQRMAASRSKMLTVQVVFNPGHTLQDSWDANLPQPYLTGSPQFDHIVLQDYSTLPVQDETRFDQTALVTYQPSVRRSLTAGTGKALLFENWALVDPYPFSTRAAYVAALDAAYAMLSARLTLPNQIVPLSRAWETVLATKPQSYLFNADGKHPIDTSIYLNAVVFYAIIFHDTPVGLPSLYLPAADAALLQNAAAQAVELAAAADGGSAAPDGGADAGSAVPEDAGIATPSDPDAGNAIAAAGPASHSPAGAAPGGCSSAGAVPIGIVIAVAFALSVARRRSA